MMLDILPTPWALALQGCCFQYYKTYCGRRDFALQGCCFKYEDLLQELGCFGVRRDFALQGCRLKY